MPNQAPDNGPQTRPPTITAPVVAGPHVDTVTAGPAEQPLPFPAIPGFAFRRVLGEGGQSIVFEVKTDVGQIVALKLLKHSTKHDSRDRFRQEAEAMARLKHTNVVGLLGWGEHDGWPYFLMPVYAGGTLAGQLSYFQEDPVRAVTVLSKIADAVQYLHSRGAVHRDLKPHNVLLDDKGEPHLSDFGLIKLLGGSTDFSVTPPDVTVEGAVRGTPAYMDPQQAAGETRAVGRAWDVWALGVMLYELLTGQRPFASRDPDSLLHLVRTQDPPRPRTLKPDLDPDLERIVLRCLARDPSARYPTAGQLAEDLRAWLARRQAGWLRRRLRLVAAAGIAIAALIALAAFLLQPHKPPSPEDQLAAARERLAAGEAVRLIEEKGPPLLPYRLQFNNDRAALPENEDGTFTIETHSATLFELLDDPGIDAWRFRVQVRQNSVNPTDRVGIYAGHQRFRTPLGDANYIVGFTFNEFGATPDAQRESVWSVPLGFFRPLAGNRLEQRFYGLLKSDGAFIPKARRSPMDGWHSLEFRASATGLDTFLDGQFTFELPRPLPNDPAMTLQEYHGLTELLPIDIGPRGGIGLYLEMGSASFRNAAIDPEPRPRAKPPN